MLPVFLAAGLVFAISGVFAALLLIAERYLVHFGQCSIDVNDHRRDLIIEGGRDLLTTLRTNDIFLPSACGGRGTCAYCKVKILDGGGPIGPTEHPLLSEQEIAENIRVSCQCKVRNDLCIEIPEELLSVRAYCGRVEQIQDLTYDIKQLRIALLEPEAIRFTPGQYVQLETPAYRDNTEPVFRAYSISSPPDEDRCIELIIRRVPGGICTTWVFEILKEGQEVSFTGPFGDFRLSDGTAEMFWIAGGSGMAPFWSMIRQTGFARPCTYFFGAVKRKDIFFLDELRQIAAERDKFTFVPALSAPDPDDKWDGDTGLITDVVARHVQDGQNKEGYLCGSPGMIDAAIKGLHEKGISDENIYYDKFA